MGDFKRKQEEIELNTYWKIKDYEDLLRERVSETLMQDYVAAEINRVTRHCQETIEYKSEDLVKRLDLLGIEERQLKTSLGDRLTQLER